MQAAQQNELEAMTDMFNKYAAPPAPTNHAAATLSPSHRLFPPAFFPPRAHFSPATVAG
jgi:hypothetical protein